MALLKQQEQMLQTKRLHLTKARFFRHYLAPIFASALSLLVLFLFIKGIITKTGNYNSPYWLILLIFPASALLLFAGQAKSLKLKEFSTSFSKQDNYKLVKEALHVLQWKIKVNNVGYIEAFIDNSSFLSQLTNQMFTVVMVDNKVLFTCISNVDDFAAYSISWWQNSRNIRRFKKTLDEISTKHFS